VTPSPTPIKWARADEPREEIVELYRRAWAHSDATIDALALDAVGQVPHWPVGKNEITLHEALVHVIVDTQRHAGQADIIRELIDGAVRAAGGQRQHAATGPGVVGQLPRPTATCGGGGKPSLSGAH
jgi:hypothetical protein